MNWCISRFLKKTYGEFWNTCRSLFRIARWGQTLCNIRSWRNVNLLYEVKFYRRKPHRFLQQEKVKKASCCRFVCIPRCQTAPHFDEWYFYITEMIYEKKFPCSRTKYEWTVVILLALFAVFKSLEIWTMTNIDIIWWTVLSIQVWNSYQCLLVFYTRDANTN
jgi:hypothetical protein